MTDHSALYASLEAHVHRLERRFIEPHRNASAPSSPEEYDLDVRAYCVLSYAALEQYVEDVCLLLMIDAVDGWLTTKSATNSLLALLTFRVPQLHAEVDEKQPEKSFFTYIRNASDEAKKHFSKYLYEDNHGVSTKHLRQMLLSVGMNVPDNARWLGSLNQLAKQRGVQAHRRDVEKVPAPEDAALWVKDCLELCTQIRNKAFLL